MIRKRGNFYRRSMRWQNLWDLRFCRRSTQRMMKKIYETLAEKGYATYDFFLPGLVIDAIENRRGTHLAAWAKEIVEKKISTVNMLGCHDVIPLLDLKGLLPKEEIERQF